MSIEFERLKPINLKTSAVIPQFLDNQWVPHKLLKVMIKNNKGLKDIKVKKQRSSYILKEWRRALVYCEQVVVNRAFLFNNDVLVDDYDDINNRNLFKKFLSDSIIVPFLLSEESPDQKPTFPMRDKQWSAWLETIKDVKMSCIRLDWGDQSDDYARLSSMFHNYIQTLNMPGRVEHLGNAFKISTRDFQAFREHLKRIASYAFEIADQRHITRNDLYQKFVVADGSNTAEGYYSDKPYSAVIKQIIDLKYNVNLSDALGRYALTPEDSPTRIALGDLEDNIQAQIITPENVQQIIQALKSLAFSQITEGMYLKSLKYLTLKDVINIRDTDEWNEYRMSLNNLIQNPLDFASLSAVLYSKFAKLNEKITEIKAQKTLSKWEPWIKLSIYIGAKAIEIYINPQNPDQKLVTTIGTQTVAVGVTPFIMRLTLGAMELTDADLDNSLDFMRGKVQNGRDTFNEIIGNLRNTVGYTELRKELSTITVANQSPPEVYDVNIYGY